MVVAYCGQGYWESLVGVGILGFAFEFSIPEGFSLSSTVLYCFSDVGSRSSGFGSIDGLCCSYNSVQQRLCMICVGVLTFLNKQTLIDIDIHTGLDYVLNRIDLTKVSGYAW